MKELTDTCICVLLNIVQAMEAATGPWRKAGSLRKFAAASQLLEVAQHLNWLSQATKSTVRNISGITADILDYSALYHLKVRQRETRIH